ncbi:hypothetical protein AB7M16_004925 [Bradyrhizobium sp. USDA 372]
MDHSYIRLKGLIGGPLPNRAAAKNLLVVYARTLPQACLISSPAR